MTHWLSLTVEAGLTAICVRALCDIIADYIRQRVLREALKELSELRSEIERYRKEFPKDDRR